MSVKGVKDVKDEDLGKGLQPTEAEHIMEEAFDLFDKDKNGTISTSEFGMVMRAIGFNPTDLEVDNIVATLDKNGSGKLEFCEFKDFYKTYKHTHKNTASAIQSAFRVFDRDRSGFIEAEEIKAILHSCGQTMEDAEIDQMIACVDSNSDGKIDIKEFVKFITQPI